jgi:hypothetical protein
LLFYCDRFFCYQVILSDYKDNKQWDIILDFFKKKKHITFWGCINNIYKIIYIYIVDGSLEVKLPKIWTDEKQSWEEAERRERLEERRVEEKE